MKHNRLTTGRLSVSNLRSNPFRTSCLILVVSILSFTLFGGYLLSTSLKNGLKSLQERLGADLAVVPLEHESDYEGIILTGEPGCFYFEKSLEKQIAKVEGVDQVTSQFYISTLAADCCSVPVQIIGFNSATDFVTQPWINKVYDKEIGNGQVIVGSDIVLDNSKTLKFFNHTFSVVAQLDRTSTGMDYSVYANMDTIQTLVEGARNMGMNLSVDVTGTDIDNAISTVLVKIKKEYDVNTVTTNIRRAITGVSIVKSKSIFSGIANNLRILNIFINTITGVLWGLSILILTVLFSVIMNGRKKEFALYRTFGATRKKLAGIVLTESIYISVTGGVVGTTAASLIVFPFSTYIGEKLQMPYLVPSPGAIIGTLAGSLLLSFAVGPLAATYSAIKITKAETYAVIREGE